MHHFVRVDFTPMGDTHCTGFYPSRFTFALEAIPFWYRVLELTTEQIGRQALIQTLG